MKLSCCGDHAKGNETVRCTRPATYGFRWGTDTAAVCCEACKDLLQAGALRYRRTAHFWKLDAGQLAVARSMQRNGEFGRKDRKESLAGNMYQEP